MKNITLQQCFLAWIVIAIVGTLVAYFHEPLGRGAKQVQMRSTQTFYDAKRAAAAKIDSYRNIPDPPKSHPWFHRTGAVVAALPAKGPKKLFAMSQDEPISTIYEAMDYVHRVGDGTGLVEIERGTVRRGKQLWYLGCNPEMGGHCWPGVQITLKNEAISE